MNEKYFVRFDMIDSYKTELNKKELKIISQIKIEKLCKINKLKSIGNPILFTENNGFYYIFLLESKNKKSNNIILLNYIFYDEQLRKYL
jgi:hypothetical protein